VNKPEILSDNEIALILDIAMNEKKSMLASRRDVAEAQRDDTYRKTLEQVVELINSMDEMSEDYTDFLHQRRTRMLIDKEALKALLEKE